MQLTEDKGAMRAGMLTCLLDQTGAQSFFTLLTLRHSCIWIDSPSLIPADAMRAETKSITLRLPQKHSYFCDRNETVTVCRQLWVFKVIY